jgi:hypothetical protein
MEALSLFFRVVLRVSNDPLMSFYTLKSGMGLDSFLNGPY